MTTDSESNQTKDRAAVAFHPPLLLLLLIVFGFIGSWLYPANFLPGAWALGVGLPIVIVALALFAWAVTTMIGGGASVPTHTPTDAIVGHGPFRFSRNPIYLSMALLLIGIGFWANSGWFLGFAVVAIILLTRGVIAPEELYLEEKFGETYLAYKNKVRRWI